MPGSKSKTSLGKALVRSRFNRPNQETVRHTEDSQQLNGNMRSITQENDLDAFLHHAQLAGTEFTAEKLNVTVVENDVDRHALPSAEQHSQALAMHSKHSDSLTIPRRPAWTREMTAETLDRQERDAFLQWRRSLVAVEEGLGLLMTPYERNLQVWRQLWRVVERSDLIVQIVDARNPLLFRCADLERYVAGMNKKNLLLINKADLLTVEQRRHWSAFLQAKGIVYSFFSAALARRKIELDSTAATLSRMAEDAFAIDDEVDDSNDVRILDADELLDLFVLHTTIDAKATIGFVGYPNVGKSSTLNALLGAKKAAVGSTPGKTKHFQTFHVQTNNMVLCDCPGLVFPSFAITKADMVCNGILPIDQLREAIQPVALVCQRIPKFYLEGVYGITINTRDLEGNLVDRSPTAEELLTTYAIARGYTKSSQGNPDESRAARYILKDYVNGKLLFVQPPPSFVDQYSTVHLGQIAFNECIYKNARIIDKVIRNIQRRQQAAEKAVAASLSSNPPSAKPTRNTNDAKQLDAEFFAPLVVPVARVQGGKRGGDAVFSRVQSVEGKGISASVSLASLALGGSKKSHKKGKRSKQRTNWTKEDQ